MILKPFDSTETTTYQYTAIDDRNINKSLYSDGIMAMECSKEKYLKPSDVIGDSFEVTYDNNKIIVNRGCAMVGGLHIYQDQTTEIQVANLTDNTYYVIISADISAEKVEIVVVPQNELPQTYLPLAKFFISGSIQNLEDLRTPVSTLAYCESSDIINNLVEAGTWTPQLYVVQGGTITITDTSAITGKYYKIGKLLFVQCVFNCILNVQTTSGSNGVVVGVKGLPYTVHHCALSIGKSIKFFKNPPTNAIASGGAIRFYTDSDHSYLREYEGEGWQELYVSGVCYVNT